MERKVALLGRVMPTIKAFGCTRVTGQGMVLRHEAIFGRQFPPYMRKVTLLNVYMLHRQTRMAPRAKQTP